MAPKQLFKTPERPTKRRKISKAKRKTYERQLKLVQMEVHRIDKDMPATANGFVQAELFEIGTGVTNAKRTGNQLVAKAVKVKYDLLKGQGPNGSPSALLLIRDNDPALGIGIPPTTKDAWQTALFADPEHSDWSMNMRNIDETQRYQIVRSVHFDPNDYKYGIGPSPKGFFEIKMNQLLKYPTSAGGADKPMNVSFFLIYWSGDSSVTNHPVIRYRLEYVDN